MGTRARPFHRRDFAGLRWLPQMRTGQTDGVLEPVSSGEPNAARDRRIEWALRTGAFVAGTLPVVSAAAAHSVSFPVTAARVLVVAAVYGACSVALYALGRRLSRSAQRGAAAAMACTIIAALYPAIVNVLPIRRMIPETTFGFLYTIGCAAVFLLIVRSRRRFEPANLVVCTIIAFLFFGLLKDAVPLYLRPARFRAVAAAHALAGVVGTADSPPNIYHLVLDGLGREDVLESRYGMRLGETVADLEKLGFVVETDATANYAQTYLSIASMLNLEYLDVPAAFAGEQSKKPLHEAIQDNIVFSTLRRRGYDVQFLASDYSATADAGLASRCDCPPILFGEFESTALYGTPFRAWLPGSLDYLPHRTRVEAVLEGFAASAALRDATPRYTFGHILSPHPPFFLDASGAFSPPRRGFTFFDGTMFPGTADEYRAGYARQAAYLLRRAVQIASRLVAADSRAVVIISGDHGPRLRFDAVDARRTDAQEVMPVFLAIRWGQGRPAGERASSLVNVYREVLRHALDARIPLLPDRAFVSSFAAPYRLMEVHVPAVVR